MTLYIDNRVSLSRRIINIKTTNNTALKDKKQKFTVLKGEVYDNIDDNSWKPQYPIFTNEEKN